MQAISYGDQEWTIDSGYLDRCNTEFMKAGLRGITILAGSGDDGTMGFEAGSNGADDGSYGCTNATIWPVFPASSPYITAVGGTQMSNTPAPFCGQMYVPRSDSALVLIAVRFMGDSLENGGFVVGCTNPNGVSREVVASASLGSVYDSGGPILGFWSFHLLTLRRRWLLHSLRPPFVPGPGGHGLHCSVGDARPQAPDQHERTSLSWYCLPDT